MSNLDRKYIDNLQKFSDALESIVELLKAQTKKGGKGGATDSVNTMLGGVDAKKLTKIVSDLEVVNKRTKKIESTTDKILTEVRAAKKAKESGMFANISDPNNKNKIVDGIKSVVLIAGAVLAIGLAFKIVGKVDFLSVVGLSLALYILAETFARIGEIKGLTKNKMIMVLQILGIMAAGLVIASAVLSMLQPISFAQIFSVIGVSLALIPAAYAFSIIANTLKKAKEKDIVFASLSIPAIALTLLISSYILSKMATVGFGQILSAIGVGIALIPVSIAFVIIIEAIKDAKQKDIVFASLAIPAIALTLLISSYILSQIANVGFGQMLSAIAIGIALIPVSIAFAIILFALKDAKMKDIVFASLAIPLIAVTLLVSSLILSKIQPVNFFGLILTSLAIGLSVLFLIPAIYIITKLNIGMDKLLEGGLAILIIATTIMIASWILSVGKYDNYPDWKWAAGVGLSLIAFLPAVLVLGLVAMSGIGWGIIAMGALATLLVAGTVLAVSYILNQGDYTKFPSLDWATGVGTSMLMFLIPMIALGTLIVGTLGIGGLILLAGGGAIMSIANLMVDLSNKFAGTAFKAYPSKEWVDGVGTALYLFTDKISNMSFGVTDWLKVKLLAKSIVDMAEIFNENAKLFDQPNASWASNIERILNTFKGLPDSSKANGMKSIISSFERLAKVGDMNVDPILRLADAIGKLSNSLTELNTESVDKLMKLSGGVLVLSLVDQVKLNDVIETLDKKKQQLSAIFDEKSNSFLNTLNEAKSGQNTMSVSNNRYNQAPTKTKSDTINEEQLKVLKTISEKLDSIADKLDKVESATSVGT